MLLRITHRTTFQYSDPVSDTVFEVRMAPTSNEDQTVLNFELKVTPTAPLMSYRDGLGNRVDLFNLSAPYRTLGLEAVSLVRTHRRRALDRLLGAAWDADSSEAVEALEYLGPSPLIDPSPKLDELLSTLPRPSGPIGPSLQELVRTLQERLTYEKKVTTERTPLSEVLDLGRGVCQDFAHLTIGVCRALRIPARYVSGYVNHPGEIATHAWAQVWCGAEVGWVDIDPTTGEYPNDDHVVIAIGRDYSDVPPNRGVWKGIADETMEVAVTVEPMTRLPNSWQDWEPMLPRPFMGQSQSQSQVQTSRPRAATGRADEAQTWPAFPNQPEPKVLLYRQQGQQQQQVGPAVCAH